MTNKKANRQAIVIVTETLVQFPRFGKDSSFQVESTRPSVREYRGSGVLLRVVVLCREPQISQEADIVLVAVRREVLGPQHRRDESFRFTAAIHCF